jgi:hypothetical protein
MAGHVAHHDPGRVLAEVAALRRLLDELEPLLGFEAREDYDNTDNVWSEIASERADRLVRLLASIDADHPDYDPAWAPEEARTDA